jgi:hypothetical protein
VAAGFKGAERLSLFGKIIIAKWMSIVFLKNTLHRRLRAAVGFCKDAPVVLQTDSDRSVSEVTTGRGDPASGDQTQDRRAANG